MLTFANLTNKDLWVAIMFYSPRTCGGGGGDWQARGWYYMPRFGSTVPFGDLNAVNNRYWCYYLENADGTFVRSGEYPVYVPANGSAFDHCYLTGSTNSRIIHMRLMDVGVGADYTEWIFDFVVHPTVQAPGRVMAEQVLRL